MNKEQTAHSEILATERVVDGKLAWVTPKLQELNFSETESGGAQGVELAIGQVDFSA